ncbi:hypothetical protein [Frisingicoccus sp.]|uniref:hypothetical protein n=1 Tax=Frisingicoccus sp. TaxID=1918627 RepID=UPI00386FC6A4
MDDSNMIGRKFGYLTVVSKSDKRISGRKTWVCRCDCGNTKLVTDTALGKSTISCGCYRRERASKLNLKHGMYKKRIYRVWRCMINRCYDKNHESFEDYGGRGISVCDEWRNDRNSFFKWAIKNGYSDDLTIDRIDVNGNYEPSNCRFISKIEQQNNKRNNHLISYNGETKTIAEWERTLNLKAGTINSRLRRGWNENDAVSTPLMKRWERKYSRQKIQQHHPELAGTSDIEAMRAIREESFKDYARKVSV